MTRIKCTFLRIPVPLLVVTMMFGFAYCFGGVDNGAKTPLVLAHAYIEAIRDEKAGELEGCIESNTELERQLVAAFASKQIAYRRLWEAAIKMFPGQENSLTHLLSPFSDASLNSFEDAINVSPALQSPTTTAVDMGPQSPHFTLGPDGWKMKLDNIFHFQISPSEDDVIARTKHESKLSEVAVVVANEMAAGKYSSIDDFNRAFENRTSAIVMLDVPSTRPSTRRATSTRPFH